MHEPKTSEIGSGTTARGSLSARPGRHEADAGDAAEAARGEAEEEITPEMISAGVAAFYVEVDASDPLVFASQAVAAVYSAMRAARSPASRDPVRWSPRDGETYSFQP